MNGRAPHSKLVLVCTLFALLPGAAGLCLFGQEPSEPAAMTELARRYEHGIGCPRDIGRALLYYKRAAAEGEPGAMVALGDLYHEGVCVPQDLKYSLDMYRGAAQAGFAPGMMRLGQALESSARQDEGIPWFRKAAAKGYGPAMTHLGDVLGDPEWYRRGVAAKHAAAFAKLAESVPSDEALQLLRQGAEAGDPAAQSRYGLRIEKTDPAQAARLFQAAAEAGDAPAMARLAHFFEAGKGGLKQSPGDALMWYSRAGKLAEPDALYWLARRHEAAGETADAKRLYLSAVGKGHVPSMSRLALLNSDERMLKAAASAGDAEALYRVGSDTQDAAALQRAASLGHVEALAVTGQHEKAAALGHIDSLLKLGRFREAAESGSPEGMYRYGLTLPDKAEGTRYVQRAASGGYPAAMRELASRLEAGSGAPQDEAAAKVWFRRAAEKNDPESLFRLGDDVSIRKSAELGYPPAMVQVGMKTGDRAWFEKAAALNYVNAWTKLGDLERAAQAGDPEAKTLLADKTRKPREAYRLYTEAAAAGYAPAMRRLGDCSIEGRGTSLSEIDGINWYRKAALHGDDKAMSILLKMGKTL